MKDVGFVSMKLIGNISTFFCIIYALHRYVHLGFTFLTGFSLHTLLIKSWWSHCEHKLTDVTVNALTKNSGK